MKRWLGMDNEQREGEKNRTFLLKEKRDKDLNIPLSGSAVSFHPYRNLHAHLWGIAGS